jgi:hypothetical protein
MVAYQSQLKGACSSLRCLRASGVLLATVPVIGLVISPWFQEHWDPPDRSVSLGAVCLESGVTHGYFWSQYHEKVEDPALQGLEVTVALASNGFDGADIYLRSDVLDAVSGAESARHGRTAPCPY